MPGDKIRDLPLNESPSDSAFTYIVDGLGGDGKVNKSALREWLNLSKSQVTLVKDGAIINYTPSDDTNTAREVVLRAALGESNSTSFVHLGPGNYRVSEGSPLIDSVLEASYGVKIHFSEGAAILYDDPEDASMDYLLYDGPRNVKNFGAIPIPDGGTYVDLSSYFQAAFNSLGTIYPGESAIELESGRILRTGKIIVPSGVYPLGGQVFYSPTVEIEGDGTNSTLITLMNNTFDSGSEKIVFVCDPPVSADVNNLFYTEIKGITFSGNYSTNSKASGVSILGGQGTRMVDVCVINFALRNCISTGCSFTGCWFPNAQRGPGLDATGGGFADILSVEHCNPSGQTDPATGRVYPSCRFKSGFFCVGMLLGEEEGSNPQTLVEVIDVVGATFGQIGMGVASGSTRSHTLLRVAGTSQNVSCQEIAGTYNGYFSIDPGTLVYDDSTNSPAGSGVPYTITTAKGTYSQKYGKAVAGLDLNNEFAGNNTFTGDTTTGNSSNFTDGLTVRSSIGNISLVGGAYSTTRTTSYFNFGSPVPHDWNNGKMTLSTLGVLNVTGEYQVDGIKVVGNQAGEIDTPSGGAVVDTQAREAINEIIIALRSHGLINPG